MNLKYGEWTTRTTVYEHAHEEVEEHCKQSAQSWDLDDHETFSQTFTSRFESLTTFDRHLTS